MGADVSVRALGDGDLEGWTGLLASSPEGSVYAHPTYLEALCRAAGGRFAVAGAFQGGELVGGVPVYQRAGRLGPSVAPRPLLYYNGPVLRRYGGRRPSEQTGRHLRVLAALERWLSGRGYSGVALRCRPSLADVRPFLAARWTASPGYTYVVQIADPAATRSRVEQNLLRLARRCQAEGMTFSDDGDVDALLRLHALTAERKELDRYLPEAAFRGFVEGLRAAGLCRLQHARLPGGRAAASQLVLLGPGTEAHVAAAGTDPAFLQAGATAFLRVRAFEALGGAGRTALDLTDAALGPVAHFKGQLGGDLRLFLVLEAPRPWAVRAVRRAAAAARGVRGALARAVRLRPAGAG